MQIYSIPAGDFRLAIVSRPRGGDWLVDDLALLPRAGFTAVVSALTPEENEELLLGEEERECRALGLAFLAFPIEDRSVPSSNEAFGSLVRSMARLLDDGNAVAVHCRAGIGRSSLIAAALLVQNGAAADSAFAAIERARGRPVPDTPEQRKWLEGFAARISPG